jgi:hypothetical protein
LNDSLDNDDYTRIPEGKYLPDSMLQNIKVSNLLQTNYEVKLTRRSIELNSSPLVSKSVDNASPLKLNPLPAPLNPQRFSIYTKQVISKEFQK